MKYEICEMPKNGDTVVVGLSGGVDSTLTAMLLKERGCRVIGVTMSIWDGAYEPVFPDSKKTNIKLGCYSPIEDKNIEEVARFCRENDIEYHVIDVKSEYKQQVLEYFKSEYRNGRTPNPCIRCNETIKFGALLEGVEKLGIEFDYFCTGHYAKIVRPVWGEACGLEALLYEKRPCMIAGATDASKDQTYFLYRIKSEILEKVRFPLAAMTKAEVKALAERMKLTAAKREESQDFIGEEYFDMIFADRQSIPGDIIGIDGKKLGRHRGIEHYTIGQRRGLGVAVSYPVYVHSIDAKNNVVVLAPNDALNAKFLLADSFVWAGGVKIPDGTKIRANVKIRLASRPAPAVIEKYTQNDSLMKRNSNTGKKSCDVWKITFDSPQRAIAPGQSAVLYDIESGGILGGGIIVSSGN